METPGVMSDHLTSGKLYSKWLSSADLNHVSGLWSDAPSGAFNSPLLKFRLYVGLAYVICARVFVPVSADERDVKG